MKSGMTLTFWRTVRRILMRHHLAIIIFSTLLSVVAGYYTVSLYKNLRTDLEELLPETARSVVDMNEVVGRLVATDNLAVVTLSDHTEGSRRFMDDLAVRLEREVPKELLSHVEYRIHREVEFFTKRRALYVKPEDLRKVHRYIREKIAYETELYNPLNIFRTTELPEPYFDFEGLGRKYSSKASNYTGFPRGYYATPDEKIRVLLAYRPGKVSGIKGAIGLREATDRIIAELDPKKYAPDMEIKITGGVQILIEEHASLISDLGWSTVIVAILVTLVMYLYFGSVANTWALVTSLFMGALWTFGIAFPIVGYLNANSAFMGSIVLGNGINFAIIFLARYTEERQKGKWAPRAVAISFRKTAGATLVAALAAGLAYGALMATSFRGFSQFGVIGLIGMVLCWTSAFTVLPALLMLIDRKKMPLPVGKRGHFFSKFLTRFVARFPKQIVVVSILLTLVSLVVISGVKKDIIESDLTKLRDKKSMETGAAYNSRYQDMVFKRYLTPIVVLPKNKDDVLPLANALRDAKKREEELTGTSLIAGVGTIHDFVPTEQKEKIRLLRQIRQTLSRLPVHEMPDKDRALFREYLNDSVNQPIAVESLPQLVRRRFSEKDGSVGNMVIVEPPLGQASREGDNLLRLVSGLRETVDSVAPGTPVAGTLPIAADMVEAITADGPLATIYAFAAVVILVIVMFRRLSTILLCLFTLLVGIAWLLAVVIAFDFKINFLNFVALPITFGIGVDYGVNIFHRYKIEGPGKILAAIENTGGAVMLASLTTIIGFGSLLLASNQAFYSLGRLAVIGEITCLAAAVLSLPAFLLLIHRKSESPKINESETAVETHA